MIGSYTLPDEKRPTPVTSLRLVLATLLLGSHIGQAADRYELQDSVPARATASRWLRAAEPDESLEMSVTLRLQHTDELAALLEAQQSPHSLQYHRWLTPDEFAARFAPAPDDYNAVVDWLQREGFTVHEKINGARIDFTGRVADIERAFSVRMSHYDHRGRAPLANENPPQLPSEFLNTVDIVRLNTFPLAEPLARIRTAASPAVAMAPSDMYVAYGMQPLVDAGMSGLGQTLAVVARSDFKISDVATFERQFNVPSHDPVKVFPTTNPGIGAVNGVCCMPVRSGPCQVDPNCVQGEEGEVLLDTEWSTAIASGATVVVDVGTDIDVSLLDIVTHHPEAKTISMSFGACELQDQSDLKLFGNMYAQAASQGQTVLVATGDGGADGCQDGSGRSVNVLASNETVTAVGGTALDPGFDAAGNATGYVSETVWNENTVGSSGGASGGGASILVAKPAYQSAPGVPADGARDQPDVALLASPSKPGYFMVVEGTVSVAGGTSAATPVWAGIVALLNDAVHVDGWGPLNATLYALGRQQYADNGPAVFHDITVGNNSFNRVVGYNAGPGYDLCTGLGSPNVALLAQAWSAMPTLTPTPTHTLIPTPTPLPTHTPSATQTTATLSAPTATQSPSPSAGPCIGDCNDDHSVTVDEIMTLASIALGTASPAACPAAQAYDDGHVTVPEIVAAARNALNRCGG